ncbi:MAG TPA: V-type ATP synthase subunit F, partial [Firmicutes bacterium]|nr:V-type ATP synthase subunit F [Bacillota bacterium]
SRDTQIGMRLAGIEGQVLHEAEEVEQALAKLCDDDEIGVIVMTEKLIKLCPDLVFNIKLNRRRPLIVEIPDRHGAGQTGDSITQYIREAIGVKI